VPTRGQTLYQCKANGQGAFSTVRFIEESRKLMPWDKYETVWLVETANGVITMPPINPYRETPEAALADYIKYQSKAASEHAETARFYAGLARNCRINVANARLRLLTLDQ
jgi:hypothetical protein